MKILHLLPSLDRAAGGPVEYLRALLPALVELGHDGEVACLDMPNATAAGFEDIKVHGLGPTWLRYGYTNALVPWLRANAGRFDTVIVRGIWQYHSVAARSALAGTGVPYFLFTHGMLDPWFKQRFPFKHLKKAAYWRLLEHLTLRDAAAVVFTCNEERILARRSFRPYQCREAVVRYGTADPRGDANAQRYAFEVAYPRLRGKRLLLYLGRLHPKKGCDLLLNAFGKIAAEEPALHLVMAGPDRTNYQNTLRTLTLKLGIGERVTWTGMLTGDEKWGAFRAAEAFVLPSHSENFGLAVAEAMACTRPVLISNRINIWREVQEAGAGLVANDTLEGTEGLLRQWLALPASDKCLMGRQARHCFLETFEVKQAAKSLVDVLQAHGGQRLLQPSPP